MAEVATEATPPPTPTVSESLLVEVKTDVVITEPRLIQEASSPRKEMKKKIPFNIFIPAAAPDEPNCPSERIRLGICAMDKKARSKPMGEILSRLDEKLFRVVFFGDKMIQNEPVEDWPICDVLIAFYSAGKVFSSKIALSTISVPTFFSFVCLKQGIHCKRPKNTLH